MRNAVKVKIAITVITACTLFLTACSLKTTWRDTTGQGRPQERAQADARECNESAGYASLNRNSTTVELEAFKTKMNACMAIGAGNWCGILQVRTLPPLLTLRQAQGEE